MEKKNQLQDFDAFLDEKYGAEGMPSREKYDQEALTFCIGQILRDARRENKVTQAELAKATGVNKTYISKIENGAVDPRVSIFYRVIHALGRRNEIGKPIFWPQTDKQQFKIVSTVVQELNKPHQEINTYD